MVRDQAISDLAESRRKVASMEKDNTEFFQQQLANELDRASGQKKRSDSLTASSSTSSGPAPPPPPDASKIKKERKTVRFADPVILPVNNAVQYTPSIQPTGVQVSGPHGAVQPNTGASMPANPTPVTTNTREDDKPLPKTVREGASSFKKNQKGFRNS